MEDLSKLATSINNATQLATKAAADAVRVAGEVAKQASQNAAKVAETAAETQRSVALLGNDLSYIKSDIAVIKTALENKYVTKEEFKTVKMLVYGFTGLILIAVVGALLSLVIIK
jgi:hypothetical protein